MIIFLLCIPWVYITSIHTSLLSSTPDTSKWITQNNEFLIVPIIDSYITFRVENQQGEVVFICNKEWRTWDFKSLNIDSNNVITIATGDMGIEKYYYNGETWIYQSGDGSMIDPDKH